MCNIAMWGNGSQTHCLLESLRKGFVVHQHKWVNAHYSLGSIELEPLRRGSTLIYLHHIPQPILMPRFGKHWVPPPKDESRSQAKKKIPSSSKDLYSPGDIESSLTARVTGGEQVIKFDKAMTGGGISLSSQMSQEEKMAKERGSRFVSQKTRGWQSIPEHVYSLI